MPKQRKRDGVYWRKDRKEWWVSYLNAKGERVREGALYLATHEKAENHEEAEAYCEEKRREIREQRNLKPGEVPECQKSFAKVADKFLAYQKARLKGRNSYDREPGIVGHLKAFFTGKLADVTPAQMSDYATARLSTEVRKRGKAIEGRTVSKSSVRKELNSL